MRYGKWQRAASILVVALIPTTLTALEPPQGKGKPDKAKNETIAVVSAGISLGYEDAREFAVASGLTGYKPLPPGIRKNLARGKPMPPGIAKTRLPSSYLNRLPAHEGYEWSVAGTDLILVFKADLKISGVLKDVFR